MIMMIINDLPWQGQSAAAVVQRVSLLLTSHAVQDLARLCGYCKLLPYVG